MSRPPEVHRYLVPVVRGLLERGKPGKEHRGLRLLALVGCPGMTI